VAVLGGRVAVNTHRSHIASPQVLHPSPDRLLAESALAVSASNLRSWSSLERQVRELTARA
jgi:hypothetical protein